VQLLSETTPAESSAMESQMAGHSAPSTWVAGPTWLLRRDRVLRNLGKHSPGCLLEIGCGAGAMLPEYLALGHQCTALETSTVAASVAQSRVKGLGDVPIASHPNQDWTERFDYVVAFEVLEHIQDDRQAIGDWASWLKPGGLLMISVPAHQRRWNASDTWAGHCRRYERDSLIDLIQAAGLQIRTLECYGFPLSNMVQPLRAKAHERQLKSENDLTQRSGTERSGVERPAESRMNGVLGSLPGRMCIAFFCQLQRMFLRTEWGNNYLLLAVKSS
jgi:SAM-dependent methyltransferase